jgi:2-C-methyl-D-erythritol 4-phosphate cytidylyltransferase
MHVIAILTAAGKGERFKNKSSRLKSIPKQLVKINRKPIIYYSLIALQRCRAVDEIFITCSNEYTDTIDDIASKNSITKLTILVEGGKTRFESVRNAFNQITPVDDELVLIHDAVRPNITSGLVDELVKNIGRKVNGIVIGTKVTDTVKKIKNEYIRETIDRSELWTVQTPQIFRYSVLKESYKKAGKKKDFTDESSMLEAAGYKVRIHEGPRENIKITIPKDIELLKKLWKK